MLRKNTAGQNIYFAMVNATTGAALPGATVTAVRSIDGAASGAATGTVSDMTNGLYRLALTAADTNGDYIGYFFTATNAIPVSISAVITSANPTDGVGFGLSRLDAAVTTRMATYTQPTGFLAAAFPTGTVANTTNITAGTVTTVSGNVNGSVASVTGAVGSVTASVTLTTAGYEAAADALLLRNVAGSSNTGRTVREAFYFLRNRWTVASGTLTVFTTDDTTSSWTAAVTGTPGADPITGNDPA